MEQNVHIQGFRIKNFKALKNIEMGRLWNSRDKAPLTPLTVLIGKMVRERVLCWMHSVFYQIA